jgi:hypothetical protein
MSSWICYEVNISGMSLGLQMIPGITFSRRLFDLATRVNILKLYLEYPVIALAKSAQFFIISPPNIHTTTQRRSSWR